MIRLRRTKSRLLRFYEVELEPPDAEAPWRPEKPVWSFTLKRRLFAEGFNDRDVSDLMLEADEFWNRGEREAWLEYHGVRAEPKRLRKSGG